MFLKFFLKKFWKSEVSLQLQLFKIIKKKLQIPKQRECWEDSGTTKQFCLKQLIIYTMVLIFANGLQNPKHDAFCREDCQKYSDLWMELCRKSEHKYQKNSQDWNWSPEINERGQGFCITGKNVNKLASSFYQSCSVFPA